MTFFQTEEGRKITEGVFKNLATTIIKTPPATKLLAKYGWYIPFSSIPEEIFSYADALEKGEVDFVNKELGKIFDKDLDSIISRACWNFPDRANILKEAQIAHESQMYYSSTILFLSSADGIFSGAIFEKNKFSKTMRKRGQKIGPFTEFLTDEISITKYFDSKKSSSDLLSRHGVMHGLDVAYGTKLNSLKALSLFDFVAEFVLEKH